MPPYLPQELIDEAIDYLWNDVKALTACALASQSCLPSARTHLFHDQTLLGAKSCSRFEAFLESSPDVTRYIRTLSISEPTSSAYAQEWVNRVPILVARLQRLATLELVGLHYVSLQRCSKQTLAAFGKLEKLVFADVYFDHFLDLNTLLASSHNVTNALFYRVGWGNPSPAYEEFPSPVPLRLKRLVVDSWASSVILRQWLLPCAELAGEVNLRTLMVRWRERDSMDVLNSLFRVCGSALEHLYVELPTMKEDSQEVPSLYHNTRLRILEIDGLVLPGCVQWTSALLQELRSTQLETLAISLLVLRNDVLAAFEWGKLDAVLAQSEFKDVALVINVNRALHPHNDPDALRSAVRGYLPLAVRRGKLTIRCS
ncbi:hypothetical protein DICSQDRAFT_132455 [Dichomitus squalens LYAD-421 SS1]|uniref:uncharacterized protein n=1 Tax=Dichomitus squalens (strain LYAD-421) TaxID=732165 RepID=UPI0004414452|nr:uncharacterized protein DICSQDRAFT_132455 [Dichomitus squalens LYAD-421 SS1]EJF66314.1 hypothetical protein DICSQDRAFT_132455 [Dichomitus squalens LYAD-421 SS1]